MRRHAQLGMRAFCVVVVALLMRDERRVSGMFAYAYKYENIAISSLLDGMVVVERRRTASWLLHCIMIYITSVRRDYRSQTHTQTHTHMLGTHARCTRGVGFGLVAKGWGREVYCEGARIRNGVHTRDGSADFGERMGA